MNIEVDMNKINTVEKIISTVLIENDFNKLNNLVTSDDKELNCRLMLANLFGAENTCFISIKKSEQTPFLQILSEESFNNIIGVTKKGLSKKSGRYQEYLYGNYLKAVELQDKGYLSDVLYKTLEFRTNLEYVKSLMKNKNFVKEWRKDFITESAVDIFKHEGNLRIINIVKERTELTTK